MTPQLQLSLAKLPDHHVLCVGDVMLDRFIYGQVDRISPEAPIPVMRIHREALALGGAGNVVRNLVSLGGLVDMVGVIGDDRGGADVSAQVSSLPGITSHLLTDRSRPTTIKTRYVANGQQLLRADLEIAEPVSAEIEHQLLARVAAALERCATVILSDYAKGVLSARLAQDIIKLAKAKGAQVLIDPKGRDLSHYHGATLLTPNRKELMESAEMPIRSIQEAEIAARKLISRYELKGVLAKLGGDGVCLVMKNETALHYRTMAREVFDVSGAGDTVVATLALCLAGGLTPAEGAELANIAGSIVVGKIGTATVSLEDLAHELVRDQSRHGGAKIVTLSQAADAAERWRKQGLRVGFTNGCFDLLHPGHISLIKQARVHCDRLILGLNSDQSVKRLKGENRPVQNEVARATVLSELADVDQVVIFGDDTPIELIRAIRPAMLMKGSDYTVDQVVGGSDVKSWGGEVVLAQLVEGQSTTATIARLGAGQVKTGS